MTFVAILLFISLALAFGMIGRKLWQLRTGRTTYDVSYEVEDWTEISVESIRTELTEWVKFAAHHGILLALKAWIIIANKIKMFDKNIKEKLTHLLYKNGHLPPGKSTSPYLRRISEHKQTIVNENSRIVVDSSKNDEEVENNPKKV